MKMICLGDSLTAGYGVRHGARWTTLTAQQTGAQVVNRGISGDTTAGMLARLHRDVLEKETGAQGRCVVMLMGGYNDIFFSGIDTGARANMGALLYQTMAAGLIPVVGIPPLPEQSGITEQWLALMSAGAVEKCRSYGAWLERFCAAAGAFSLDFRAAFLCTEEIGESGLFLDGIHPNEQGHRRMAQCVSAWLQSMKKEESESKR